MSEQKSKLIHVAKLYRGRGGPQYAMLRQMNGQLRWHLEQGDSEEATDLSAESVDEALRLAQRRWRNEQFTPLHCGFRYDTTVRDEHGINAQFWEMVASYGAANIDGSYYDEEAGHRCYVGFASDEARQLWHRLRSQNRL